MKYLAQNSQLEMRKSLFQSFYSYDYDSILSKIAKSEYNSTTAITISAQNCNVTCYNNLYEMNYFNERGGVFQIESASFRDSQSSF